MTWLINASLGVQIKTLDQQFYHGAIHCSSAECPGFLWGCVSWCSWWGMGQPTALWVTLFVAANRKNKWAAFPADERGESCGSSAWEVSGVEQKVYPGPVAGTTAKWAEVRHGLSKVWLGFLCTNLNLGLATECTSRRVSHGINMRGSDCFGGSLLQRKEKLCL